MSRFRPRISPSGAVLAPPPRVQAAAPPRFQQPAPVPVSKVPPATEPHANLLQRFGFWVLCAYMISGTLNDWMMHLAHTGAYLSVITLVALPVCWLICGAPLRGLKHSVGIWWAAFLGWLLVATPFSIWRGGSVQLLVHYIPRSYMLFFFAAALTISVRKCRQLMYVNAAVAFATLLTCIVFGTHGEDGRYFVPGGAGFFGNSNELAMQLLMGVTQFVYLFSQGNVILKFAAGVGIAGSMPYILWTGSRGGMLGAIAYCALLLYVSRNRGRVLAVIAVVAAIGMAVAPTAVLHRLTLLTGDESASTTFDSSAIESQISRITLLKRSVSETLSHPLFGVGPDEFPVQVMQEARSKGEWFQWLGTHNSYTQITSESGIPGFLFYVAAIFGTLKMNFKLWKRSRTMPGGADITALSMALLSGGVVFAVCSFFFHMAYTGTFPYLAGQSVALYLAVKQKYPQALSRQA